MDAFVLLALLLGLLSQISTVEGLPPPADNTRPLILHLNDIYQYNGSSVSPHPILGALIVTV